VGVALDLEVVDVTVFLGDDVGDGLALAVDQ
jgi:hypothetical protein